MIARGQTHEAQAARLAHGCCPIHGLFMSQCTRYLSRDEAKDFGFSGSEESVCVVRCPRKDCLTFALARGAADIVKVLGPVESAKAEELETRCMKKFHRFVDLVRTEIRATRKKKDLTPDEWEECYQLSRREPS